MNTRTIMIAALGCGLFLGAGMGTSITTNPKPAPEQPWLERLAYKPSPPVNQRFVEAMPEDLDPRRPDPYHSRQFGMGYGYAPQPAYIEEVPYQIEPLPPLGDPEMIDSGAPLPPLVRTGSPDVVTVGDRAETAAAAAERAAIDVGEALTAELVDLQSPEPNRLRLARTSRP